MSTIALLGAGGKMGQRLNRNLRNTEHNLLCVETNPERASGLLTDGLTVVELGKAVLAADVVILAVPDVAIGKVAADVVPQMKSGAMLILLDPAAAFAGLLPSRSDVSYLISHPCHPSVFNDEETEEARRDFFGGLLAKQAIVCALMQGPDEDYEKGESIAKQFYAPVMRAHRMTVEQMAMLEPTMAETIGATMATMLRAAMEEAASRGVPYEAARDFMLGHINIELAIAFGEAKNPFSDACLVAIEYGRRYLFREGWEQLFNLDKVHEQIDVMLHPEKLIEVFPSTKSI